jgi:hypothetical protein
MWNGCAIAVLLTIFHSSTRPTVVTRSTRSGSKIRPLIRNVTVAPLRVHSPLTSLRSICWLALASPRSAIDRSDAGMTSGMSLGPALVTSVSRSTSA